MTLAFPSPERRLYLLSIASGALLTLSFPPFFLWPLAWIALVPLYLAIQRCDNLRQAANVGGVAGLVFYSSSLWWLIRLFGPLAAAFWCLFALWLALHAVILWTCVETRTRTVASPALWIGLAAATTVGIEYFRAEVWWLHCSWMSLGYSQATALPIFQSCALWGLYGLSGAIAAVNASAALLPSAPKPAGAALAFMFAVAAWGGSRVAAFRDDGDKVPSAALQNEDASMEALVRLSLTPEARSSRLIVWPEYGFDVLPGQHDAFRGLLADRLRTLRSVVVAAAVVLPDDSGRGKMQNFAWVLSPDKRLLGRYDKLHPIPFVESHQLPPNPTPRVVETPVGAIGVQICYDLDFQDGTRKMVRQGAKLLAVPNMDPTSWPRWQHVQHSWMSPARAVESGLWIVRAASSGFSQIVDPVGRIRASMPPEKTGVLAGDAYARPGGTVFSSGGWLIGPLCLLLGAVGAVIQFVKKRAGP
ncbi:MAG: hypothetical protein HY078_04280 [Elusimicrobia bacterium]|nr:hypothetical protein [Elusimicrobiota bacterium]